VFQKYPITKISKEAQHNYPAMARGLCIGQELFDTIDEVQDQATRWV
jgi:hypothetical protein